MSDTGARFASQFGRRRRPSRKIAAKHDAKRPNRGGLRPDLVRDQRVAAPRGRRVALSGEGARGGRDRERVGVTDEEFGTRSKHAVGQEVSELCLRPPMNNAVNDAMEICARVDVVRDARRDDREDVARVSLHDAIIERVRWKPSAKELRLRLVASGACDVFQTVDLIYRGAMLGRERIESLRNAADDREACILYDEIDVAEDGTLTHRLLFWPNQEATIEFRELEYSGAPRNDARVTLGGAFVVEAEDQDAE